MLPLLPVSGLLCVARCWKSISSGGRLHDPPLHVDFHLRITLDPSLHVDFHLRITLDPSLHVDFHQQITLVCVAGNQLLKTGR
jgi:hypothetical protein